MSTKIVYLMRGLPSCGKSYTARQLAGETGVVCETDEYFYTQVGADPSRYNYHDALKSAAQQWNFARFIQAVKAGVTPIVVDRGNSLSVASQRYARYAVAHGYEVALQEPTSPWWQELRVLLKYQPYTRPILDTWADRLAQLSRSTHRVPAAVIRRRMEKWKWDLTVRDILTYNPRQEAVARTDTPRQERQAGRGVDASAAAQAGLLLVFDAATGNIYSTPEALPAAPDPQTTPEAQRCSARIDWNSATVGGSPSNVSPTDDTSRQVPRIAWN